MVTRDELVAFLDDCLRTPAGCHDPSNNGLQVEGRAQVAHIVFGVDASRALIAAATDAQADFIMVHHGMSWRDNLRTLTGYQAARLRLLFAAGLSLYAVHLPLDAHPELGNNAVIATRLRLADTTPFFEYDGMQIGMLGTLPEPLARAAFIAQVGAALGATTEVLAFGPERIARVGVVSGGGADAIGACAAAGCQCLVTGEFGHADVHVATEVGMTLIAAGHYRTEVWGVQAVMARIQAELPVTCEFIDLPTGY